MSYRTAADAVRRTLEGWDLHRIINGRFDPWVGSLEPAHQIWARPDPASDWAFEVLFEDVEDGIWHYRRNPAVTLPEKDLITPIGSIPTLHLGVSLLYKGKRDDDRQQDGDHRDHEKEVLVPPDPFGPTWHSH